jgi:hypothetical protein
VSTKHLSKKKKPTYFELEIKRNSGVKLKGRERGKK